MPEAAEIQSKTADVTIEAFNTFAEDIGTMFDAEVTAQQVDIESGTIDDVKGKYKKLAAVCSATSEGALNGEFHVVFDKEGLFTLAGTFVMQPAQIITQNRKGGGPEEASEIGDALGEVGNLMIGAWDRVFREEMTEHGHFVQSGTFFGDPWKDAQETIRLTKDQQLDIYTFEMNVEPIGSFQCSALYPVTIYEPAEEVQPEPEEEAADDESGEQPTDDKPDTEAETEEATTDEATDEAPAEETEEAPQTEEPTDESQPKASDTETPQEEASTDEHAQAPAEETADAQQQTEDTGIQTVLDRKILRHGTQSVEALDAVVKDQFLPERLAVGCAEKSVMLIFGDVHPDYKNRV